MKSFMLHMLRNAGWCIATTYRKTETTKMVYTKIKLPDCKDHYYVVINVVKTIIAKTMHCLWQYGNYELLSTSHQEILDEESVDVSGVPSKINQEYGISITEEKLAGILSSHQLLPGAKFGRITCITPTNRSYL